MKTNPNQYTDKLFELGYDDMDDMGQLQEMTSGELADITKEVAILEKPGDRK